MLEMFNFVHTIRNLCGRHFLNSNDPNYIVPSLASSILSFVLYSNTFSAEFVYDDSRAIINNHDLLPEAPWYNLLMDDFWGTPLTHSGSHKSYRPLTVASFRLNYQFNALNPFGYHFINVLLHSVVAAFVSTLSGKLSNKNSMAWLAGLLFAVHPIHTESVAGVVGRADVLATLFGLLSFINYLIYKENASTWTAFSSHGRLFISIFFAFLAMLAKEQGITILGLCILYDFLLLIARGNSNRTYFKNIWTVWRQQVYTQKLWLPWICLTISIFCFLTFRIWIMGVNPPDFSPSDNPAAHSDNFLTRFLTFCYLPVFNLKLLLLPSVLSFDWSMDSIKLVESFGDVRNILSLILYTFVGYSCVKMLNLKSYTIEPSSASPKSLSGSASFSSKTDINGNPCQMFDFEMDKSSSILCSNVHCAQTSLSNYYIKEKQMYKTKFHGHPLTVCANNEDQSCAVNIAFFALLWIIVTFLPASNLLFYVGFVVAERILYLPSVGYCIIVSYGAERLLRRFHSTRLEWYLKFGLILVLLIFSAKTYKRNQDWSNEESLYKSGIVVNPSKAYSNLGNVLSKSKRLDEAEFAYRSALVNRPNMADAHYNLGILLQETGRWEEAMQAYEKAILCREKLSVAHLNLGIVLVQLNRKQEAEERYRKCSALNVEHSKDPKTLENAKLSCLYNLGRLLADQGKHDQAIKVYHKAIERLNPYYQTHSLYNMLGESYAKLNDFQNAEKWYQASLRSKSDHVPAHLTYGHFLMKQGQKDLALKRFQKAVEINPHDIVVYQHLGQYYFEIEQFDKAEEIYLTALQIDPNNFDTVFSLANVLRHLHKNEEAERFYRKSVQLKPTSSNAHMNFGAILHLNKKYDEAENSYLKSLEFNPDDNMTKENLRKLKRIKKK